MDIIHYPSENGRNALIVFTGLGGSAKSGKYVKIAENATKNYNFHVYVVSVPDNCWANPQSVFEEAVNRVIEESAPEKIYIFGNAAGASLAVWYAYLYPQIKKVLAVNPVLNLNVHRTRNGVLNFLGEKMFVFIGENDPSAPYFGLLPHKDNAVFNLLEGVDHFFSEKTDEFISLPNVLFTE